MRSKLNIFLVTLLTVIAIPSQSFGFIWPGGPTLNWGGLTIVNPDQGTCTGATFTLASVCAAGTSYCTAKLPTATTAYQVSSSGGMRVKSMRVTNTNQFADGFTIAYGTTNVDGTSAPTGVAYYAASSLVFIGDTATTDGIWNETGALNFVVPNNDYLFFVDTTTGAGVAFFQVCLQ